MNTRFSYQYLLTLNFIIFRKDHSRISVSLLHLNIKKYRYFSKLFSTANAFRLFVFNSLSSSSYLLTIKNLISPDLCSPKSSFHSPKKFT